MMQSHRELKTVCTKCLLTLLGLSAMLRQLDFRVSVTEHWLRITAVKLCEQGFIRLLGQLSVIVKAGNTASNTCSNKPPEGRWQTYWREKKRIKADIFFSKFLDLNKISYFHNIFLFFNISFFNIFQSLIFFQYS